MEPDQRLPRRGPALIHGVGGKDDVRYRCVGIGVGPANLSLASLLYSHPAILNLFIEKNPVFEWHDGQLVPGATLQVSLLKDLVSLADPTSVFSFLSYLHTHGRIYHFLNAQFDAIPRQEYRNYLEWASRTNKNVVFGEQVLGVEFHGAFLVHTTARTVTADNIAVGIGQQPWVPPQAQDKLGASQFHVSDFVRSAGNLTGKRVVVIGGGQSGAEAFLDLISRTGQLPRSVAWVSKRRNFFPLDDSPFTNDFYMPSYADYFFQLERQARETFNTEQILTSDGIGLAVLQKIYQRIYVRRFLEGAADFGTLLPNREVLDVTSDPADGWELTLRNNDRPEATERVGADVVIWATGFRPPPMDFLAPLAGRLEREDKEYKIDQDFAVRWDGPVNRSVFMQNAARQQRGLAEMNLSLLAWRSQRIVDRIRGVTSPAQRASFVEWPADHATRAE
jgi:lysine N6-hydroxylase